MSTDSRASRLKQFFGGNFHQDWDVDSEPYEAIVRRFAAATSAANSNVVAQDIYALVASISDDATLEDYLFGELGCYYDPTPDGLTMRAWLTRIASILSSAQS